MVSIKEVKCYAESEINNSERLFNENELEKASCIANVLNGLTVQEAEILLDKIKFYLLQSIFSPEI